MSEGVYFFLSHRSSDKKRLRPIVLRMLDAGIPLWIDLPEKILNDQRVGQVGKIPFGSYWADEIERSVTDGDSYVLFCWSKEAARRFKDRKDAERGGLRWELGQGLARRRVIGVRLDNTPLSLLPAAALDINWADLSDFRPGQPSEVFNRLLAEMKRKVDDGHSRIADRTRQKASERRKEFEAREPAERKDLDFAVYEVDRSEPFEQSTELMERWMANAGPARPLIVIGPDDEAPDMFLERCRRVLPKSQGATVPNLRLEWTREDDFQGSYRRRLSHSLTGRSSATMEELAKLLADQGRAGQARVAVSFIEASSWDKAERHRITAWTKFWAELDRASAGAARVLPVLCVWMAAAEKPWRNQPPTPRGQPVSNEAICKDLARFKSTCLVAGPLSPFSREQALPWRDRIREELGGATTRALSVASLFDSLFDSGRKGKTQLVSMHTFAAKLRPPLTGDPEH